MRTFKWKSIRKRIIILCLISVLLSCVKGDDPLISYEGRVFIYVGPYISHIGINVDDSDLSPAVGVTMQLHRPGACGLGHCGPGIELDEQTITDSEGYYSLVVRSQLSDDYYVSPKFPENIDYSSLRGSTKEIGNQVIFADIILVDTQ